MNITKVERHSVEELMANMKHVGMMTRPELKVYADSKVELAVLDTDNIAPAQRYVLAKEILKVRDLRWALKAHGIDLFKLDGYVTIYLDGNDEPIDVLPPVIEESCEANATTVRILNDGMHRVYLARMERTPIQVLYARDLPKDCPYYAFPLVNGWQDVEIKDDLPSGYIKKWHRIENYKSLYRDFNTGFQNVGGPRGHFTNGGK